MDLRRRDVLKLAALGTAAVFLPLERVAAAKGSLSGRLAESQLPGRFTVPFTVPPVLQPVRRTATTDLYDVAMTAAAVQILPGRSTPSFTYNGLVPGPTIRTTRGRPVVVRQTNRLPGRHPSLGYQPTTSVHLHGSASLPQYDGYASDLTAPGQYKDYRYPNIQESRMAWYHDHGIGHTAPNVYMGLAGVYLMEDEMERALPIPHGRYDVPLVVQDAMFSSDGTRIWDDHSESGIYGDVLLVNGRPWPAMQVERRKYRFRILNASVSRSYRWQLSTGDPLIVIGTDAGLMPAPQPVRSFRHGMAERYEVVIDFARYRVGERVVLQNLSNDNNIDYSTTHEVMAFDVVADASDLRDNAVPDLLNPANEAMLLKPAEAIRTRRFDLIRTGGQWTINGKTWADVAGSDFRWVAANPGLNEVEIWEIRNGSGGWFHPVHIHLVDFQVLDRNGRPPYPHERGPKDVVYVGENETVRVMMRFGPQRGRYMMHCHNLVHEDHDMMTQFEVGSGGDDPRGTLAADLPAPAL